MRKRRKPKNVKSAAIALHTLSQMHQVITEVCRMNEQGPGTEAYSLMCSLGASLGTWPRLRRRKVAEQQVRYDDLMVKLYIGEPLEIART